MKKIVYVPIDERPCNYDFPYEVISESESLSILRPGKDVMGKKKQPADCERLCEFLLCECRDADYLILALDTLLYGGIIPSRLHRTDEALLKRRLATLKELKRSNPKLHISAFSLVMRCPCYSDSSEEPDYYDVCGREIFLWGQNEHKYRLGEISREKYEATKRELAVCEPYIDDYEHRRATNLNMLVDTLGMVGEYIDELTILQDDSNPRGYTSMDRACVLDVVQRRGIDLDTYPGADEGGLTLLARAATQIEGRRPKIFVAYPREGAENVIPIYEDREIKKTVSAQIGSAGAIECFTESEADIVLFCNLNDEHTYDVYLSPTRQSDESYVTSFVGRMSDTLASGRGVAVADVAYCNAGDLTLALEIERCIGFLNLWGYAGWNTSSNTVGTVLCQGVLRYLYGNTDSHRRFTALRVMDDVVYSAVVRPKERERAKEDNKTVFESEGARADEILQLINQKTEEVFPRISEKYRAVACRLPWNRLFEIELKIEEK